MECAGNKWPLLCGHSSSVSVAWGIVDAVVIALSPCSSTGALHSEEWVCVPRAWLALVTEPLASVMSQHICVIGGGRSAMLINEPDDRINSGSARFCLHTSKKAPLNRKTDEQSHSPLNVFRHCGGHTARPAVLHYPAIPGGTTSISAQTSHLH